MFNYTVNLFSLFRRHRWLYGLLAFAIAISINLSTSQASYGGRWWEDILQGGVQAIQLQNLSDQQEVEFGQQINQELVNSGKINLSKNRRLNNYIQSVGRRLAPQSNRPKLTYTFQVINDNSVNAFATMGGYVYVHTGLIKLASNEAELASVMAHEIGHIVGKHSIKQMRNAAIKQGLLNATGLDQKTWVNIGVQLVYDLPYSRKDEIEADQLGLKNLTRAGYAPSAMVSFMKKLMAQEGSGSTPAVLSTHPNTAYRIQKLQEAINPRTANVGDGLDPQAYRNRINAML
jgi:predicted Zn-dependent protease